MPQTLLLLLLALGLAGAEHAAVIVIDHLGQDHSRVVAVAADGSVPGYDELKAAQTAAYTEARRAYTALPSAQRKTAVRPSAPDVRVLKPYAADAAAADVQLVGYLRRKGLLDPARWRPFADDSPWNTPLAADAAIDPHSRAYIDHLAGSCPPWPFLTIGGSKAGDGKPAYGVPCYFIDAARTPMRPIPMRGLDLASPEVRTHGAPIPSEAYPEVGTRDAHMAVVDIRRGLSWEFYHLRHADGRTYDLSPWDWSPGTFTAEGAFLIPTTGSGVLPPWGTVQPWLVSESTRASGFPLVAGLVRAEHVAAGRIPHALVLLYPRCRADWFIPPASRAQGHRGKSGDLIWTSPDHGLPCGARVRIRADVDITSFAVPPAAQVILRALQEYGAFIADGSGAISLTLDDTPTARAWWQANGIGVMTFTKAFDAAAMRATMEVVAMPDHWWKGYTGRQESRPDRR